MHVCMHDRCRSLSSKEQVDSKRSLCRFGYTYPRVCRFQYFGAVCSPSLVMPTTVNWVYVTKKKGGCGRCHRGLCCLRFQIFPPSILHKYSRPPQNVEYKRICEPNPRRQTLRTTFKSLVAQEVSSTSHKSN